MPQAAAAVKAGKCSHGARVAGAFAPKVVGSANANAIAAASSTGGNESDSAARNTTRVAAGNRITTGAQN